MSGILEVNGAGFLVVNGAELALAFLGGTVSSSFIHAVDICKVEYM